MRILIVGASGTIGRAVVGKLEKHHEVICAGAAAAMFLLILLLLTASKRCMKKSER